jgi:hypothetical protein
MLRALSHLFSLPFSAFRAKLRQQFLQQCGHNKPEDLDIE